MARDLVFDWAVLPPPSLDPLNITEITLRYTVTIAYVS